MTRSQPSAEAHAPRAENPMSGITAALATITAADELRVSEAAIEAALARSAWGSVRGMLAREFQGAHRGYHPKCRMDVPDEAAIAAAFDALAEITGDPRRAMRTEGRTDG